MLGYVGKSPSGCLFDGWVKFFKAVNKGVQSARAHHSFGKVGRMLSYSSENEGSSFLIESLKI
jgi:hypothetical protein